MSQARQSNNGRGGAKKAASTGGKDGGTDNKNRRKRKGPRKKKVDPTVFWGDPTKLAEHSPAAALITTKPSAVIQSLGRPPLSGQQHATEHYFAAVYDRAVNLAGALAAAGNLIEPEELLEGERSGH